MPCTEFDIGTLSYWIIAYHVQEAKSKKMTYLPAR